MEMIKNLVAAGERLHTFDQRLQDQILIDLLYNFRQSEKQRKSTRKLFLNFVIFFFALNDLELNSGITDSLEILVMSNATLGKEYTLASLTEATMMNDFKASPQADLYQAILENAYVYSLVTTFKFNIPSLYMRAKQPLPGTQKAMFADRQYAAYTASAEPLLAAYVRSQHKLLDDRILGVMGFVINPQLVEAQA